MNAFTTARRMLLPLLTGALLLAVPALAADDGDGGQGYLGVMLQDMSPAMAKALQLDDRSGVLVSDVVEDSPAAASGLQAGDVILAFAGEPLSDHESLTGAVRSRTPGEKVEVTVLRDGKKQTVEVELGERKDAFARIPGGGGDIEVMLERLGDEDGPFRGFMSGADRGWLGVRVDDLSAQLGEYFEVEDGDGALVSVVEEDSPAAAAGLKAGDVIVAVDGREIGGSRDLRAALADAEPDQEVEVTFVRKGKEKRAQVVLGEAPEGAAPHLRFFGGDDEYHIRAPKMMHRHLPPMGKHDVRVRGDGERRMEIIRERDGAGADMKRMRAELEQLREDLEQLRRELKEK